jgi:hypothetical protein
MKRRWFMGLLPGAAAAQSVSSDKGVVATFTLTRDTPVEALMDHGHHYDPITEREHCSDCGCEFGEDEAGDLIPMHRDGCQLGALLDSPAARKALER